MGILLGATSSPCCNCLIPDVWWRRAGPRTFGHRHQPCTEVRLAFGASRWLTPSLNRQPQVGSCGKRLEIAIPREQEDVPIQAALCDQRIAEARLPSLRENLSPQD